MERLDPATVTGDAVRLWRGTARVAARITSDFGGVPEEFILFLAALVTFAVNCDRKANNSSL